MFPTLPSLLTVAPEVSGTVLASGTTLSDAASAESNAQFISIFWITLVALISPILSRLTGKRIPDVVFLLILACSSARTCYIGPVPRAASPC